MRPEHFREVSPDRSCEDCQFSKRNFEKHPFIAICTKHDFEFVDADSRTLRQTVCDDVKPYSTWKD